MLTMLSSNLNYSDYKDPERSDILDTSALILKAISPFQRGAMLLASHKNKDKRWEICQDCGALSCL